MQRGVRRSTRCFACRWPECREFGHDDFLCADLTSSVAMVWIPSSSHEIPTMFVYHHSRIALACCRLRDDGGCALVKGHAMVVACSVRHSLGDTTTDAAVGILQFVHQGPDLWGLTAKDS